MIRYLIVVLILSTAMLGGCNEQPPSPEAKPEQPLPRPATDKPAETSALLAPAGQVPAKATVTAPAPEQNSSPCVTRLFLRDPVKPQLLELATDALGVWRTCIEQKPTLLLLSNNPLLVPVPEEARPAVTKLLNQGSREQISTRGRPDYPDPLLLPGMAVDAALRLGWFERLYWAIPLREVNQELSLDTFRKQMLDSGLADQRESDTFSLSGKVFSGQLRGFPLTAATLPNLPELAGPVVVHIDLSYFEPLYKNEISTPLLPIIGNTLKILQARNVKVLAVTISQSNLDQSLPLDVRFLGEIIETLANKPEILGKSMPSNWKLKSETLYLENFFQEEMIKDKLLAMEKSAPKDASVKFALYRAAAANKEGGKALDYLAKAVALDKAYALEYLPLSLRAYDNQRPDEAMRMLTLAGKAFPNNPHIKLKAAQLAQELGDTKTALHLVEQLRQLPWSPTYYPDMPTYLSGFSDLLNKPQEAKPAVNSSKS